jgi:hypothetical protein
VNLIPPPIKEDLTTTRSMSISQTRCSQRSTRNTPSRWSSRKLEDAFRSTRKPVVLDYEELRSLSDPGPQDYAHGIHLLGQGVGHDPHPAPTVTTCNCIRTTQVVVELVGIEGNYPSRVGLLSLYLARISM